jgi:hypothetical protein
VSIHVAQTTLDRFARIDALVNNAGVIESLSHAAGRSRVLRPAQTRWQTGAAPGTGQGHRLNSPGSPHILFHFTMQSYLVPERKVMFRQNPNIETRNSKQIRIPNDKGYGQ